MGINVAVLHGTAMSVWPIYLIYIVLYAHIMWQLYSNKYWIQDQRVPRQKVKDETDGKSMRLIGLGSDLQRDLLSMRHLSCRLLSFRFRYGYEASAFVWTHGNGPVEYSRRLFQLPYQLRFSAVCTQELFPQLPSN
jgi:hypothetical protein